MAAIVAGGVCLAIARPVPHQAIPMFSSIKNLIAVDIFNRNRRYTVVIQYLPPSEPLPTHILDQLHIYNPNLMLAILTGTIHR